MEDRPTTDLSFGKISNGHISARDHQMFGSMWGFRCRWIEWRYFDLGQINKYVGENNARGVIFIHSIQATSITVLVII